MRSLILASFALLCAALPADEKASPLPELRTIKTAVLSPSYSCRPAPEFAKGYAQTALFVSQYSHDHNAPDLLFNGACRSADYFASSTSGDDMDLIADLGPVALESITAHRAFNLSNVNQFERYSRFARVAAVQPQHTYAILLNKGDVRGLIIAQVVGYVPNTRVDLRYALLSYQVVHPEAVAKGFQWDKTAAPAP